MTTYTRPNRIAKRDAYLLKKYKGRPAALIDALKDHAVLEPFDHRTASVEELKERWNFALSNLRPIYDQFRQWSSDYFPKFDGTPVAFIMKEDTDSVEVVLRQNTATGIWSNGRYTTPKPTWTYHSVDVPSRFLYRDQGFAGRYVRKLIRTNRAAAEDRVKLAKEAEERRQREAREKIIRDIAATQKTLDNATKKLEELQKAHKDLVK
jgi:hypothetical protein